MQNMSSEMNVASYAYSGASHVVELCANRAEFIVKHPDRSNDGKERFRSCLRCGTNIVGQGLDR